jgi:hypothetical protein
MFYERRVFPRWTLESTAVVTLLLLVSYNEIKIAICHTFYWRKTALSHNTVLPFVCQTFFMVVTKGNNHQYCSKLMQKRDLDEALITVRGNCRYRVHYVCLWKLILRFISCKACCWVMSKGNNWEARSLANTLECAAIFPYHPKVKMLLHDALLLKLILNYAVSEFVSKRIYFYPFLFIPAFSPFYFLPVILSFAVNLRFSPSLSLNFLWPYFSSV